MASPLWTFDDLVAVAEGIADGAAISPITGFSIDTRSLVAGEVFVALADQRDGHEFVGAAFARGAAAALVRRDYIRQSGDGALVRVDEPLRALERIGIAARARLSTAARVIAVTGSAGKTGTKEMLRACLAVCATAPERVHAPEKSFNNHWGVPLTLARMPAETEFGVFEIGMNHAGEIRPLTRMVRPHLAIVTNVLPVHVGNFPDGETGVAKAKAEVFEGLVPGGTAIVLRDSPHYALLRRSAEALGANVLTFGGDERADAWFDSTSGWVDSVEPITLVAAHLNREATVANFEYRIGIPGDHIVTNSLAVLVCLDSIGCLSTTSLAPLALMRPTPGRGGRTLLTKTSEPLLLIDESYNANPRSMLLALSTLGLVSRDEHRRHIAVLGDMLELGSESKRYHEDLLEPIDSWMRSNFDDLVFCCGPMMRHLFDILPPEKRGAWAQTSIELIPAVVDALRPGDAVMVKGSLGSRMAPIVDAIKKRFADR
jgi:UDP-N-acetylmuramoyl-tripeptide--D-alanyl-D-alanine ligase